MGYGCDGFGIVKADTREEVISKLGLPAATIDTVERYNKMCEAGVDTDFYKTADKLISIGADDGPFYGASFSPGFLTSLGACAPTAIFGCSTRTTSRSKACSTPDA